MTHLFLITEIFYPDQLGGGLMQFIRYADGLRSRGVVVHVTTVLREHHRCEHEEWHGVEIIRFPACEHHNHRTERKLVLDKTIQLITREFKGVGWIQPNGVSWGSTFSLLKAKWAGIPSVFYFTMFPPEVELTGWRRLKATLRISICLLPFHKMIFCSRALGRAFRSLGNFSVARQGFAPNGVDLSRFSPPRDPAEKRDTRRRLGLPEEGKLILYVGGMMPRKGCDLLIRAWGRIEARHPDAQLLCVGSQGMRKTFRDPELRREMEAFQEELREPVDTLSATGRLLLVGEVSDVEKYYKAADLFVFPSRREGLPNAVLEAMASGLPCLLAPFQGFPDDGEEFGRQDREFKRIEHQLTDWEEAINSALTKPGEFVSLGTSARKWMEQTQSWEKTLDSLANLYGANRNSNQ